MPLRSRLAVLTVALAMAAPAAAQSLRDEVAFNEGLIAAFMAYEIGDKCDELEARMLRGIAFLEGLRDQVRDLGHSDAEIEAYLKDEAEKARLLEIVRARFRAMGGVEGDYATYCAVGRAEIAAGTQIGRLLR